MANLREIATWEAGIYQWETSDPVMGGENGIDNKPTRQLANRTQWLKTELAKAVQSIGANKSAADSALAIKADKTHQISAGAGLTGGGDLSANRTIGLATPSTLSGSTTNWVGNGATGHTHEIARATPTLAGVVKLVNVLNSTATDAALTAAQGKALQESKLDKAGGTMTGMLHINIAGWAKMQFPTTGGNWKMEFDPKGATTETSRQMNFNFNDETGERSFIRFPPLAKGDSQLVAYQSWVNSQIQAANYVALTGEQSIAGNKTFTGSLNINNPNQWEKLRFQTKSGYWRLEGDPKGAANRRLNFNFADADDPTKETYIWFPTLTKGVHENIAYQSWVNSQIQAAITPTYQKIGNFEITKFPDGTMIQITSIKLVDIVPESQKGVSGELTWAIAFKNKPWVQIQKTWASEDDGKGREFFAPTSVALMVVDYLSTGAKTVYKMGERWSVNQSNTTIKLLAIGRWK